MKPLTLILCIIAILGSAASTFFFFEIGSAKELLKQEVTQAATQATELQTKLNEAAVQSEVLQKRLAQLDSELGESKLKASAADGRSTQIVREMAQLRTQLTTKTDAAQVLTTEISQLKQELAQVKLTASTTTAELSEEYKSTITNLQARLTDLIATTNKTTARNGKATPAVNQTATPVVEVTPPLIVDDANGFQVVSIGTNNAFIVIKAGVSQGIEVKQNLIISRSGKFIGQAIVSSSQSNYTIAQVVAGSLKANLSKGDLITFAQ